MCSTEMEEFEEREIERERGREAQRIEREGEAMRIEREGEA